MVINIRRSRPDEGDKLTAIWCRSVDATHDFLTKAYRKELEEMVRAFLPEAPLWVAVNTEDQPSGYADDHPELEQFAPHDDRRPEEVASALAARGLQPVWKDWDSWLGRASQTS